MGTLTIIIEQAENNYSAYVQGLDGIVVTGASVDDIRQKMSEAICIYIDTCKEIGEELPKCLTEDFTLVFKMKVEDVLNFYKDVFTKSALERLTGINQKQLWHYANGKSKPRLPQQIKIENALHKLGAELSAIRL